MKTKMKLNRLKRVETGVRFEIINSRFCTDFGRTHVIGYNVVCKKTGRKLGTTKTISEWMTKNQK